MSAAPPVTVRLLRVRSPPGPSTSNTRTVLVPSIAAPLPFTPIRVMITGSPFSPLSADLSAYEHPAAKLIVPPPAAFTALTAATKAAWPAHGTLTLEGPARATVAGVIQNASSPRSIPRQTSPASKASWSFPVRSLLDWRGN
jgi:hypothetical protein